MPAFGNTKIDLWVAYWGLGLSDKYEEEKLFSETYSKSTEELRKKLTFLIKIYTSFISDIYLLIEYKDARKLSNVIRDFSKPEVTPEMLQGIVNGYEALFNTLGDDHAHMAPEFMLQVAMNLTNIDDKTWAHRFVYDSMKYWFGLRGVNVEEMEKDQKLLKSALEKVGEQPYLERLSQCSQSLGQNNRVTQVDALWETWCELKVSGAIRSDKYGATLFS
jgi:hypothetical protein